MTASNQQDLDALRYPVGKFTRPAELTSAQRAQGIAVLEQFPQQWRAALAGLDDAALDTPYREGGWTLRQLTHHVADSHMSANSRMRMALTEDWPTIKPYDQTAWAELDDARSLPAEVSLGILDGVHARWVRLLRSVPEQDWQQRGYDHPESGRQSLEQVLALYDWHSRHHLGHITGLRARKSW